MVEMGDKVILGLARHRRETWPSDRLATFGHSISFNQRVSMGSSRPKTHGPRPRGPISQELGQPLEALAQSVQGSHQANGRTNGGNWSSP